MASARSLGAMVVQRRATARGGRPREQGAAVRTGTAQSQSPANRRRYRRAFIQNLVRRISDSSARHYPHRRNRTEIYPTGQPTPIVERALRLVEQLAVAP